MLKKIDIAEILRRNSRLQASDVKDVQDVAKLLKELGIEPEEYNLRAPFSQRQFPKKEQQPRSSSPLRYKR